MKTLKSLLAVVAALFLGFAAKATVAISPDYLYWSLGVDVVESKMNELTAESSDSTFSGLTPTWEFKEGALPDGVTFANGVFSGTPTSLPKEGESFYAVVSATFTTTSGRSVLTDAADATIYIEVYDDGGEGTSVDFECTSPTIPEDNTYRMSTGESVTFTLSPKDAPPEDAQYVWGSFNTSGSFSVLSSGSLTYTFRASSAGNYNISFYAYTGTAPDFDTGSNLVGNWGCTVEVTAPTPTSVTFTGVSPTMPRTGGSYVTTNGYTTVFEASASTLPEGSSISSVNLAWYRVYEDTAAGTVREQLQDKGELSYSFYSSYCNYVESLDYQIVLVAYTGTDPDFTSSSNILAQYSWNVTEMARPAPSYEFSIEPGSYEWEIGQTQTISVTERNSDGSVTYTWEYYSTERSLLESGKGDSFSFTVSESGSLRLAIYETTVTVRTNVYWYVTAKSSEGGGGSEGGEESTEPSFSASSPANTDPVSMTVGTPTTFVVTAENAPTDVQYVWYATSEIVDAAGGGVQTVYTVVEGATDARCVYTPTSTETTGLMCLAYQGTEPDPAAEVFDGMIGQVLWDLAVSGGGETTEPSFSASSPANTDPVSMTVGTPTTFVVKAENAPTDVQYVWYWTYNIVNTARGTTQTVYTKVDGATDVRCTFTPTSTETTGLMCLAYQGTEPDFAAGSSGGMIGQVNWDLAVSGGETSEVTLSPTTLAEATQNQSYAATISIGGVSSIVGGSVRDLPTGLSYTFDTRSLAILITGTPTVAGSFTVTVNVQVDKSSAAVSSTVQLTVKESSGGGEEEEEEGGDPNIVDYSPKPIANFFSDVLNQHVVLAFDKYITMKIGQKTNLTVNVCNADGVRYSWVNPSNMQPFDSETETCEYTHEGGERSVQVNVYDSSNKRVGWVTWQFNGNEAAGPEEDTTTEKDYLPILAESNEAMTIALQNRVSLRLGAFSKPIVRKNGAALSGITVQPVGATPGDVNVSSEGVVSGTMTEDLVGETLTLKTSWADGLSSYVMTNVLTFAKRTADNTAPYLAGSLPADAAVTAYTGTGNQDTYTVFAYDEEANTLTYKWFFDGEETAYTQNWFTPKSSDLGEEGSTHTVACYACESDGAHQEIPLKTWTLTTARPTFAIIHSTFGANATVGGSGGSLAFRQPANDTYALRLDVVKGALPPGISTFGGTGKGTDASAGGIYRKAGTYSFTLRGICSNGEVDERDFVITVSGTDSAAKTWSVGSSSGSGATTASAPSLLGTEEKGDATTVSTITQALIEGAAAGDTIDVYATDGGSEDLSAFRYLEGITVTVHCNISLAVGKHVPDLTPFTVEADKGYQFKLSFDAENYLLGDDSYGALAPIAKLNEDTPYQLDWSLGAPYFIGTPAVDADGYLSVAVGLTSLNESTDLLHLPDNEAQRAVVFENATFAKDVKVVSDGVLPATITFKGTNTFVGTFNYLAEGYQDEMKMIVKSNAALVFAGGALYDSKLGGLVLEQGATLKFNPADGDMIFYGYRLYLPNAGEDKVRFELTGTREASAGAYNLSARYMGDDDPMNVIEIVPQPGDAANYRVYRGAEQALMFAAVTTPDAGGIVWTEDDNASFANGTLGTMFTCTFNAHGGPVSRGGDDASGTGRGSASGSSEYSRFEYSLTSGAYTWSRDTENTFDNTVGTRELMQASYRVGASDVSAPVEIGFPFPCGTNFISKVNVGANSIMFGAYTLVLQDKGFLASLTTLSHIYIDRQNGSFMVRYGEFASVTLTPDGKIRVAFGPAADTRYGDDPQVPLYWLNDGSVYGLDFSSAEPYAGSNDVIITPSCPPGLRLEGNTLTGVPLVAGAYTVNVKVVADGYYETNRAFAVTIIEDRFAEDIPVLSVTKQPETDTDGYVHLDLNATAEFEASVADGNQMRWTLDGAPLDVSDGAYTLTAPATRSLDAAGAKIHCLAIEADDGTGRWNWSVRKSWQIVYNRAVYVDASKASSDGATSGGTTTDGTTTGGTTTGRDGTPSTEDGATTGSSTADGLTAETAFGEFPENLFKYLLNGDEVIVASGTYAKPIDFLANTAQVTIRAADENAKPVIDLTDNDKGYTRCFRQGYYSVEVGKSGTYEQIYQPCTAATVRNFVFKGGAIEEDEHDEYAMQLYPETSANYYGVAGGGVFGGTFQYCQIRDCSAKDYGGGAYGATLQNCVVENCTAATGGGCANCNLMECTIVNNTATKEAGGIDGQCTARSCIILGNEAAGAVNDYDNTTTPVRLVPYIPSLTSCFTTADGDPMFCADYHLASGSPAVGKGAYPTPDATACLVFVEIVGGGTVSPNAAEGTQVAIDGSVTFTIGDAREIEQIYTNGAEIAEADLTAAIAAKSYTLANVQANTTVSFVFQAGVISVGDLRTYKTITEGINAACSGDTIQVDPGTYEECLNVSTFAGKLIIEAADTNNLPVVNANNSGRCVIAKRGSDDVIFRNMIFENGNAEYTSSEENPKCRTLISSCTDAQLLAYGFGGGVFGGRFVNCTIRNSTAQGGKGGGAFDAKLIGCTVTGNAAGNKNNDDILQEVLGGGVYGGYADTCNISTNSVKGYKTQVYCLYDGAGTYDAEVRNSFVWDNYIDSGSTSSRTASDAKGGENGVVIHTEEKLPTEQRLEDHKDPIPTDGTKVVYKDESEAETAAAKQVISISTEVAKAITDQKAYENLFDIKPVETSEGSGEYVNKPVLREEVATVVETQLDNALTGDANGNEQSAEALQAELTPDTQVMTKTLKTTTPGLYYALEFSSDMSEGSFKGERHLATGSGSVKLQATSLQTSTGFWRVNVYLTPDGD